MNIKPWGYIMEFEIEKEEILSAIEEVLNSGTLILGEKVRNFEKEYAAYCEVKHGVGVDNGTNALFLALKALNIGTGDEVITVSNTAVATVSAIVSAGARPVFTDIAEDTLLMDVTKIERVITSKTKCIMPVHLFGCSAEMDEIGRIAKKYNLKIIEDCAQSHGATYKGKKAGSFSDIAATSFYPTKILGTYGDGGMAMTNDERLYQKLKRLRFYGLGNKYNSLEHGYNCRLDEIHAAILLKKFNHLDKYIARRRTLAERYTALLSGTSLILPVEPSGVRHAFYLYVLRHPSRDIILDELKRKRIFFNIHYPLPIHLMDAYKYLGYKKGDLPITEKIAGEIFSLPIYPSLSDEAQLYICNTLIEALNNLIS